MEVAAQTTESHNEGQKVVEGEKLSQKHQQHADDAHSVAEAEKIETYTKEFGRKFVATQSMGLEIQRDARQSAARGSSC